MCQPYPTRVQVVADVPGAYRAAWARLAAARGLRLSPHARLALEGTAPERIIMDVSAAEGR